MWTLFKKAGLTVKLNKKKGNERKIVKSYVNLSNTLVGGIMMLYFWSTEPWKRTWVWRKWQANGTEERREDWSRISHVINGIMKCNIMNIKFIMDPYLIKTWPPILGPSSEENHTPLTRTTSAEKKWKDSRKNIGFLTDKDSITKYPLGFT